VRGQWLIGRAEGRILRMETPAMPLPEEVRSTVKAFVFDAYGTLFDVHASVARYSAQIGANAGTFSAAWRAKQLEYTWTYSLMGIWVNFWMITQTALDHTFARFPEVDRNLRGPLLEAYRELESYPDARRCLVRLGNAGYRRAILSNGESGMLQAAIAAAGLSDTLDAVFSVDEIRIFKPAPQVYEIARRDLNLQPHEVAFVSSNRWDVAGASAFGFVPIWVNRTELPAEYPGLEPIATVKTLAEIG
jgi:2-haloacid dehalogenase